MQLRNKEDGKIYNIQTDDDIHGWFAIFAYNEDPDSPDFLLHYSSLAAFLDDWEDVD